MGKGRRFAIILLVVTLYSPAFLYAETVILKSGRSVECKIVEKTDKYIKIDFQGIILTYYLDEIQEINGEKVSSEENKQENPPLPSIDDFLKDEDIFIIPEQYNIRVKAPKGWTILSESMNPERFEGLKSNVSRNFGLEPVVLFFKSPSSSTMMMLGVSGRKKEYPISELMSSISSRLSGDAKTGAIKIIKTPEIIGGGNIIRFAFYDNNIERHEYIFPTKDYLFYIVAVTQEEGNEEEEKIFEETGSSMKPAF